MTPTASNGIQQAMAAYLLLRRAAIEDIGGSTEILHEAHRAKGIESSCYIAISAFSLFQALMTVIACFWCCTPLAHAVQMPTVLCNSYLTANQQ
jgi:hypothetical protein